MRSIQSLKVAFMLGLASLSLTAYAANGPDVFMNGKSYYGEPTSQVSAARVVDIASSGAINVPYGETVTFRSEGKQFSWTFNGLGGRAVNVTKIARPGSPPRPSRFTLGAIRSPADSSTINPSRAGGGAALTQGVCIPSTSANAARCLPNARA